MSKRLDKWGKGAYNKKLSYRGVAKFGIALGSGPRGPGFESRHSDHRRRERCIVHGGVLFFQTKERSSRMEHQIIIETEVEGVEPFADALREVIPAALAAEGVELPCEVDVLFTDDEGIHQINREQRDVDRATDVLSFPMFEFTPGEPPTVEDADLLDPGSGLLPLGDMVLSVDHIKAQAAEFGHSERRELCYLAVHSVLHLLGYDHLDEGPQKRQMRAREEAILGALGITREGN